MTALQIRILEDAIVDALREVLSDRVPHLLKPGANKPRTRLRLVPEVPKESK